MSTGAGNINILWFADYMDALVDEEQELESLVEKSRKRCTRYKTEISAEKTKLITNTADGIQSAIMRKKGGSWVP